jgi:hypothetical protein
LKIRLFCLGFALITGILCKAQDNVNDLDAQDYIFHANIVDFKEKTAIIKLFRALKYYGIWDNIHALYLPTGGTELSHSLNAKDPRPDEDAYPLIFPNGATHTNSGVSFNGIDQGAMSFYRATSTRLHLMVYQSQIATSPFIWSGDRNGETDFYSYTWSSLFTGSNIGFANSGNYDLQPIEQASEGFFYGQRIKHDSTQGYFNGNLVSSWVNPVSPSYNADTSQYIWLNKSNQFADFLGTTGYVVVSIGNCMSGSMPNLYYQIIQAFLSELGIQNGNFLNWPAIPDNYETLITSNYRWHKATENAVDTAIDGVHLYSIRDSLYLWGGWNGHWYPFDFNNGFVSGDGGKTWERIGQAPWNIRHSAAYGVDSLGRGYLIGSDSQPESTPTNRKEVWRTRNGRNWLLRTENAPWSGDLVLEGLAIKGTTLYIAGGQFVTSNQGNDTIWKSDDGGKNWVSINTSATQLGGILYNNFKYFKTRNKFIAFCGGKYDSDPAQRLYASQVWSSDDCITWTRENDIPFEPRQYSDMVEWDNKLWVFGGDRPSTSGGGTLNLRSLWYMDENGEWHEAGSTPLPPRHASGLTVDKKNNRLVIACGNMHTDVWYLEKLAKGPEFAVPISKNVPISDNCSVVIPDLSNDIDANFQNVAVITQNPLAGTLINSNSPFTATVTLKDFSGIERGQLITLIPVDSTAPAFSVQDTVSVALNPNCSIVIPNLVDSLKGTDNCGEVSFYQLPSAGTVVNNPKAIMEKIEVIGTDEHDNTSSHFVIIKVKDIIPPVFSVPDTVFVNSGSDCKLRIPNIVDTLKVYDNCGNTQISQFPEAGSVINNGGTTINILVSATDEYNNTTTHTVMVKIRDTIPPKFACPPPQIVGISEHCHASVPNFLNTLVAEDCGQVILKQIPEAGTVIDVSNNSVFNVAIIATDESNNTSTCIVPLTIKDTTAPVFKTITDIQNPADVNQCGALVNINPPAVTDNCAAILTGTRSDGQSLDASYPVGNTVITWKATDASGNESIQTQNIVITDEQSPIVNAPSQLSYCYSNNSFYKIPMIAVTDNCGIAGISYKIQGNTNRSGNDNASGIFNKGVSTIWWSVKDNHGNETTVSTTVKINDPLEITIPDVYPLGQKTEVNALYIGYGPSSTILKAETEGGEAPYNFAWSNNAVSQSINIPALAEGTYNFVVFAQDASGCKDSASKQIRIMNVQCNESGVLVCKKEWNQTSTECVDSSEVESLLSRGSYLGSCKNFFTTVDPADSLAIETIPNPSNYFFKLLLQTEKTQKISIRIYNNIGQLLDKKEMRSDYINMDFGYNYLPGVYFAEIISGEKRKIVKLIKTSY